KVEISRDGVGFGPVITVVNGSTGMSTQGFGIKDWETAYFRVRAVNEGGMSIPSEIVAFPKAAPGPVETLVVNARDRWDDALLPVLSVAENLGSTNAGGGSVAILRTTVENTYPEVRAVAN